MSTRSKNIAGIVVVIVAVWMLWASVAESIGHGSPTATVAPAAPTATLTATRAPAHSDARRQQKADAAATMTALRAAVPTPIPIYWGPYCEPEYQRCPTRDDRQERAIEDLQQREQRDQADRAYRDLLEDAFPDPHERTQP
jgi:hypothetical protein